MKHTQAEMINKHLQELESKLADLKKRWPAHSVPISLMQELDDLEQELADARTQAQQAQDNA
jgi:ribosomal protein L29